MKKTWGMWLVGLAVLATFVLVLTYREIGTPADQPAGGLSPRTSQQARVSGEAPKPTLSPAGAMSRTRQTETTPSPRPTLPPIARPQLDAIPASLNTVMGQGEKDNYFTRLKAVHGLGTNLSQAEVPALYMLLYRKGGEDKLPLDQLNAVKNDVVNALKTQETKPADLARHLMAMFYDEGYDVVWRDYCVQHLGSWYRQVDKGDERQGIVEVFWRATEETGTSIAGTALIALSNNADQPETDRGRIAMMALALSEDSKCGELARITALQVCAKLGEKGVLPTARKIAESSASVPLRMSAIAAIGTLGAESDRPLLEKYASSSDGRLRTAAQSALQRLGKQK